MFTRILYALFSAHGSCPYCGASVSYTNPNGMGETRCPKCHKPIKVVNGKLVKK